MPMQGRSWQYTLGGIAVGMKLRPAKSPPAFLSPVLQSLAGQPRGPLNFTQGGRHGDVSTPRNVAWVVIRDTGNYWAGFRPWALVAALALGACWSPTGRIRPTNDKAPLKKLGPSSRSGLHRIPARGGGRESISTRPVTGRCSPRRSRSRGITVGCCALGASPPALPCFTRRSCLAQRRWGALFAGPSSTPRRPAACRSTAFAPSRVPAAPGVRIQGGLPDTSALGALAGFPFFRGAWPPRAVPPSNVFLYPEQHDFRSSCWASKNQPPSPLIGGPGQLRSGAGTSGAWLLVVGASYGRRLPLGSNPGPGVLPIAAPPRPHDSVPRPAGPLFSPARAIRGCETHDPLPANLGAAYVVAVNSSCPLVFPSHLSSYPLPLLYQMSEGSAAVRSRGRVAGLPS